MPKINIKEALEQAKALSQAEELTADVQNNLEKIKEICNTKYYDSYYYGNTALNRTILRDPDIAKLLTSDVLKYIFTTKNTKILELTRYTGDTNNPQILSLKKVICDGFSESLEALKYMTANEPNMSPENYEIQKGKYKDNTTKIIANIGKIINKEIDTTVEEPNTSKLLNQFEAVCGAINTIKKEGSSAKLLYVNQYGLENMRGQARSGFGRLCGAIRKYSEELKDIKLKDEELDKITLDKIKLDKIKLEDLAKAFLSTPDALLEGWVIHGFYDRAHIEAALEQDTMLQFSDGQYTFQDIFRAMVKELCTNPTKYPIAVEQFVTRFNLVEVHLSQKFETQLKESQKNSKYGYKWLISASAFEKVSKYHDDIKSKLKQPGKRLEEQLKGKDVNNITNEEFIECILNSKELCLFAEKGEPEGWNNDERQILSAISLVADVEIYDEGERTSDVQKIHDPAFDGTTHYINGPVLSNIDSEDYKAIVEDGQINQEKYNKWFEDRLLQSLIFASKRAINENTKALVTLPGIGCGYFAGEFKAHISQNFDQVIEHILATHSDKLQGIGLIQTVGGDMGPNNPRFDKDINGIKFRKASQFQGLLKKPEAWGLNKNEQDAFKNYKLHNFAAWDPYARPGNEIYQGNKTRGWSNDPQIAGGTNILRLIEGIGPNTGYSTQHNCYVYDTINPTISWQQAHHQKLNKPRLKAKDNILVMDKLLAEKTSDIENPNDKSYKLLSSTSSEFKLPILKERITNAVEAYKANLEAKLQENTSHSSRQTKIDNCLKTLDVLSNLCKQNNATAADINKQLSDTITVCKTNKTSFGDRTWIQVLQHIFSNINQIFGFEKAPKIKESFQQLVELQQAESQQQVRKI